jgi:hypothetical protein
MVRCASKHFVPFARIASKQLLEFHERNSHELERDNLLDDADVFSRVHPIARLSAMWLYEAETVVVV